MSHGVFVCLCGAYFAMAWCFAVLVRELPIGRRSLAFAIGFTWPVWLLALVGLAVLNLTRKALRCLSLEKLRALRLAFAIYFHLMARTLRSAFGFDFAEPKAYGSSYRKASRY